MTTFIRSEMQPQKPPPQNLAGFTGWARTNLFSSPLQSLLTLFGLFIIGTVGWTLIDFMLIRAVWTGTDRDACLDAKVGRSVGACWPFVWAKMRLFMVGFYPAEQIWRVNLTYLIGVILLIPLLMPKLPYKTVNAILFFAVYPFLAFNLLVGGPILDPWMKMLGGLATLSAIVFGVMLAMSVYERRTNRYWALGLAVSLALMLMAERLHGSMPGWALPLVETRQWGGLLVSIVVSVTGIVVSMPLGIMLALGRRSKLPLLRYLSVGFIELVRGVPLITVLFFATYMLPMFLEKNPDALVRVLIGVSLFSGAYMAEVIRGGLQAIPKGQFEGAMALGLGHAQMMALIILPQALKIVIPGIVNLCIALFKDTTLVSIVAIFDLLGQLRTGFSDANWTTPVTLYTGFAFAGIIYFLFCFAMSRYSLFVEKRLNTSNRH